MCFYLPQYDDAIKVTTRSFDTIKYEKERYAFVERLKNANNPSLPLFHQAVLRSQYYKQYYGTDSQDLSFCLTQGADNKAFVFCHEMEDHCGYDDNGAHIILLDPDRNVARKVLDNLLKFSSTTKAQKLLIADTSSNSQLALIGSEVFKRNGVPHCRLAAIVDLSESIDSIRRNLRRSYRSLITRGQRVIEFKYVNSRNPDSNLFAEFRNFHLQIAGRSTRSEQSWATQFEMVKAGVAELIMGIMKPYGLVTSALFIDFGNITHYAVSVNNRDLFKKPISHACVYEGIVRAKERGQEYFNLGSIPARGTVSEKEYNIGQFKKGFCDPLSCFIEWHIPL